MRWLNEKHTIKENNSDRASTFGKYLAGEASLRQTMKHIIIVQSFPKLLPAITSCHGLILATWCLTQCAVVAQLARWQSQQSGALSALTSARSISNWRENASRERNCNRACLA